MGVYADLQKGVYAYLVSNSINNVAWPNVTYTPSKPYYRINYLPSPTTNLTYGGGDILSGLVQIDVVIKDGIGSVAAASLVDTILALFARNCYITEGTTLIRFEESGWAGPAIQEESGYFIPVSIPYKILT
jgi:hypothetical protein